MYRTKLKFTPQTINPFTTMRKSILPYSKCLFFALLFGAASTLVAQDEKENIVQIIDELTLQWDNGAEKLGTYDGLRDYCRVKPYRDKTRKLLDNIHHYDTVLYLIVKEKYAVDSDPEAKATIDDIETLETDYTTKSFLVFLREECQDYNEVESNLGSAKGKEYEKERNRVEKELSKYIKAITKQVDTIDEHVHHLKGL